ncbi:MAG: bifunctional adenosylcobinamide kinase/adenosylcobinamide-phosphate guanylyltransferase [Clostridium sp.]|nr:bifunctional adenosylcobinamide kinase/adenosylcobinamide-phosphate guanylyltransferase [Clostridium sp.]
MTDKKMMVLIIGGSNSRKSAYGEKYIDLLMEKASFAEKSSFCKRKYYLATMAAYDDESREKIEKHRRQRRGKGFITIEQPTEIGRAVVKMKSVEEMELLEKMGFERKAKFAEEAKSAEEVKVSREKEAEFAKETQSMRKIKSEKETEFVKKAKFMKETELVERAALLECISNLTANEMFSGVPPKSGEQTVIEVIKGVAILQKALTHLVVVSNNVFEDGRVYDEATTAYIRAMGEINKRLAAMADKVVEVVAGIPIEIK